jgi:hypothetical protein
MATGGFRNRNPRERAAADQRLKPRDHWDRPFAATTVEIVSYTQVYSN